MFLVVAVVAMSIGYLGNEFALNAQEIGVGEKTIESPVSSIAVSVVVSIVDDEDDIKDSITECIFRSTAEPVPKDSMIFCKLLDKDDSVIAEGSKIVDPTLAASTPLTIPIDILNFAKANEIDNIVDIFVVVKGP